MSLNRNRSERAWTAGVQAARCTAPQWPQGEGGGVGEEERMASEMFSYFKEGGRGYPSGGSDSRLD